MRAKSLALRLVAGAALWIAAALLAGGLALSALFRDYVQRSFDARLTVYLESLVAVSEIDAAGHLRLTRGVGDPRFEQVYSGWYWQITAPGMMPERSRSLWDQTLPAFDHPIAEAGKQFDAVGPDGGPLRVVERGITLPGSDRPFRYVVAADPEELGSDISSFDTTLAWSLGLLGAGLLGAVFIQVRYGLQPLRRIRAAIVDIRSGRANRLTGDFPAEIRPLSNEINVLLDHNAAVVERARTHVSNLAHALKTPLSVLANDAGAATGPLAEAVLRQTAIMRRQINHYLTRARAAATGGVLGARTELQPVIDDLCRTLNRIYADRQLRLESPGGTALSFRGERQDLEEMLGNLLDNACKWARSRVRLDIGQQGDRLTLCVDDDGPGLTEAERAALFQRGKRFDESVPGSGLGLAIVRDIAELYAGAVSLDRSPLGGLRARLELPAAMSAPRELSRSNTL